MCSDAEVFPWTQVPVKISNSALVSAVMGDLTRGPASNDAAGVVQADLDRLSMSTNPFLEKSLEFLSECMDDLAAEQQKVGRGPGSSRESIRGFRSSHHTIGVCFQASRATKSPHRLLVLYT